MVHATWSVIASEKDKKQTIFMNLGDARFAGETVRRRLRLESWNTKKQQKQQKRPGQGPPRNQAPPGQEPGDTGPKSTTPTQSDPRSNGQALASAESVETIQKGTKQTVAASWLY